MIGCTNDVSRSNFAAVFVWDTSVTSSRLLSKHFMAYLRRLTMKTTAPWYSARGPVLVFSMNANTLIPVHRWEK